jgi:AcrR family transcriptional regulator
VGGDQRRSSIKPARAGRSIAARGRSVAIEDQPRRQRRPHEKLERLITSATKVFGDEGYAHARIQAVCRAAGVSVGTFYDHFENKADLMLRVAERASETLPLPEATSLRQLEDHVAALAAAPTAGISRAWLEAIHIEPGLRSANERFHKLFVGRYTKWVVDARARRRVRSALDDDATARIVLALLKEAVSGTSEPLGARMTAMTRAIWFVLYAE